MPLQRCKENNKSGWRWGNSGKCYTGKTAKKDAIKQGIAIEGPDKFKKEVTKSSADSNILEAINTYLLGKKCCEEIENELGRSNSAT